MVEADANAGWGSEERAFSWGVRVVQYERGLSTFLFTH